MSVGNRKSQSFFAQTPEINIQRSSFDRSFTIKDTFNFDELTPMFLDEVLPGDTINLNLHTLIRLQTQVVPIMDNMYTKFFFFYCPSRLLWDNFTKMMGERLNPSDSINFTVPQISLPDVGVTVGSLAEKLGFNVNIGSSLQTTTALPFRMYNKIWNEWFRSSELQDQIVVDLDNGPDDYADYSIKKINKKHDYFTSALANPQKGTALQIPASSALVTLKGSAPYPQQLYKQTATGAVPGAISNINTSAPGASYMAAGGIAVTMDPQGSLEVGLQAAMGTINELRTAFQLQTLLERDNRGGTRYNELIYSHFKVTIPDYRLQRTEYLGGGLININTSAVPNTGTDLADLGAFATASSASSSIGFTHSFQEHGYIIGLAVATADITYQQGINKLWSRRTRYDFFWPELQQLGEQAILNQEIYYQGTSDDTTVWAYAERYAEYKFKPSEIHGEFRSQFSTPLDMWHLAQEFSSLPAFNSGFLESATPIDRVLTSTTNDALKADYFFKYNHTRPMMAHPIPAGLGRF